MGTMVPLPASAGTPVQAVDAADGVVAALCGQDVFTGRLAEPDSWALLCRGDVDVAVRGGRLFTGSEDHVDAVAVELTGYAAFGWPVPGELRAAWSWYEAGHWPCALTGLRLVVY